MTLIECPACKSPVDIDRAEVKKEKDGLDVIVTCPDCGAGFILQQVAQVRQRLQVAQYGYTVDQSGQQIRVKLVE
jgi:uncharacterized Zn finger protein